MAGFGKTQNKKKSFRPRNAMIAATALAVLFIGFFGIIFSDAAFGEEKYPDQRDDLFRPEMVVVLVFFAFVCAVYTIPSFVAYLRFHDNFVPILIINIFFGWTLLGWVACLAWAFSSSPSHLSHREINY